MNAGKDTAISRDKGQVQKREVVNRLLSELTHPPENELLYRPIREDDQATQELADSIREHGVKDPLLVSLDDYIISGNRRATAARMVGLKYVPCTIEPITRNDSQFLRLLREMNRQRLKSPEELAREVVLDVSREEAHQQIVQYRQARVRPAKVGELEMAIRGAMVRSSISAEKEPMLLAAIAVIDGWCDFWPLTVRQVHYGLLNDPPYRNARTKLRYVNDNKSYKDLCDLLIRARLTNRISPDAIDDETREIETWNVNSSVHDFIGKETKGFLKGYYRNLQIGQPLHIEVVGEKNTIANVIRPVCADYCVPMTLGRGYSSLSPRLKMVQRFRASGRDRLALLFVSDFDPEGQDLPHAFARSLRDDLGVDESQIALIKVALNMQQVKDLGLPPKAVAKKDSTRRKAFVSDSGGEAVHELEAVPPHTLQRMLREAIEGVMDVCEFRLQQNIECEDAVFLARIRAVVIRAVNEAIRDHLD